MEFKQVNFGFAAAEKEASDAPQLLLEGYYDYDNALEKLTRGHYHLLLGAKGMGKTAIAQKIRLEFEHDSQKFVRSLSLGDFSHKTLSKVSIGDIDKETKFSLSWTFLILLQFLSMSLGDMGAKSHLGNSFAKGIKSLEEAGLLGSNLNMTATTSAKHKFKANLPAIFSFSTEWTRVVPDLSFIQLNELLWDLVESIDSDCEYMLIIDGLDEVLTKNQTQRDSLAGLVTQVNKINQRFSQIKLKAKIVLLIRADLFESLPQTNKTKWRQDSAIELDWYSDPNNPEESELASIANLRASSQIGREIDIFSEWFSDAKILSNLLDHTRHRPRDLSQLLRYVQNSTSSKAEKVPAEAVRNGIRQYSQKYFYSEVKDELVGFLDDATKTAIFHALSTVGERTFKLADIYDAAEDHGLDSDQTRESLTALYECSALGTIRSQKGYDHYTFKYRNPHSAINFRDRFILHRGIWKALNLT